MTATTAVDRILDALTQATGHAPRRQGGQFKARCPVPAHGKGNGDRNPSLSVTPVEGEVLVHCHAGCGVDSVLDALRLQRRDLYDEPRGKELARYQYTDAAGRPTRTVHRHEGKQFRQSGDRTLVELYRLPQVLDAVREGREVFLVEGEKDTHALESLGLVATTAPMGASNFGQVDVSPLKGARVVTVVDRDAAGARWATAVRERLDGYAATLRLVEAAAGKDAADHVAAGHGADEFVQFDFADEPGSEPALDPAAMRLAQVEREAERERVKREARRLVDAEQRPPVVLPELLTLRERLARPLPPVTWRIDSWQPADARVMLAAQYKAGKTTMTGNVARCLVDGDPFLGQHKVTPIRGRLALLDFEMSARQLDAWLGDQRIVNDDRIMVFPLRGSAAAFDILDPAVRARWARVMREQDIEYVLWDCLRPVMDALGLDEHSDAGRLLVAYDALLREADVSESLIVHHMGHTGERSRGDSRIRDWPDVEWRLVRQDADDPASPRYVTAFGRDVDVPESQLSFDPVTRHLTLLGGSRKDAAATSALRDVLNVLAVSPRLSGRQIEDRLSETTDHHRTAIREAIKAGVREGRIVTEPGPRRAVLHSQCASAPEFAASAPAHSSECASALIESALHSDTRRGSSAPAAQCRRCDEPLDDASAAGGFTTHPGCGS